MSERSTFNEVASGTLLEDFDAPILGGLDWIASRFELEDAEVRALCELVVDEFAAPGVSGAGSVVDARRMWAAHRHGTLVRAGLAEPSSERRLRLTPRIVAFFADAAVDPPTGLVRRRGDARPWEQAYQDQLKAWTRQLGEQAMGAPVHFLTGDYPANQCAAVRAMNVREGAGWWRLRPDEAVDAAAIRRELLLERGMLVVDLTECGVDGARLDDWLPELLAVRQRILVFARGFWFPFGESRLEAKRFVETRVPKPSAQSRLSCIKASVEHVEREYAIDVSEGSLGWLEREAASVVDGPVELLRCAASRVSGRAGTASEIDVVELTDALDRRGGQRLGRYARRIECRYDFDDLVLADETDGMLCEIVAAWRHRESLLDDWGFGKKHVRHAGITALFYGSPGTGKTMAAEVLAGQLGRPLYQINLSAVVSKWIGETEKTLERIFSEAEQSGAMLVFDEADALFGKRTEVSDSHDRYANIQVDYLLHRIERFEGIAVLTTNLVTNLDDAFLRRILFRVPFPEPRVEEREAIWRKAIPSEAEVGDVDLHFLADAIELTGGHIRNAAQLAAIHARANGGAIEMEHLMAGVRRELQKLGKPFRAAQMAPYQRISRIK
ncbi:MAG: ATP-binding protein [Myxococcota bacterium]